MGETIKQIKGKVVLKSEYETGWNQSSYIPEVGELVFYKPEIDENGEPDYSLVPKDDIGNPTRDPIIYTRQKNGDGVHFVRDLPFHKADVTKEYVDEVIEELSSSIPGQKVENGGEIFNDYNGNQALSEFSHAEGTQTVAGSKAFGFNEEYYARTDIDFESVDKLDNNKGWYHLNSTAGIKEAIDKAKADTSIKELKYTVLLTNNYDFRGVIEDVDEEENRILVTNFLMPNDKNPSTGKLIAGQVLRTVAEHGSNRAYILLVDYNDFGDIIIGEYSHAEGDSTCAAARASHAEGRETKAVGKHSHAEGRGTYAAYCAHAEGQNTVASGDSSHTEGAGSKASGFASHAENEKTVASGKNSHAQGKQTTASGENSFAASQSTTASGTNSSAFGYTTVASGENSIATGERTTASGKNSFAHGANSIASSGNQFVVGYNNKQDDEAVFIVGNGQASTEEGRNNAFAVKKDGRACITVNPIEEGDLTPKGYVDSEISKKSTSIINYVNDKSTSILNYVDQKDTGIKSQIATVKDAIVGMKTPEGGEVFNYCTVNKAGQYAHAEGSETTASGNASHAEGVYTVASNSQAHAEGFQTEASGEKAHAEGHQSRATGSYSHAEGYKSDAEGNASHAEGFDTTAGGQGSHSEGYQTTALGTGSHSGGTNSKAFAHSSFAHGKGVIVGSESNKYYGEAQTVLGKYNKVDHDKLFIIGGGSDDNNRANVFTIDKNGRAVVGEPTANTHAANKKYVDDADAVLDNKITEAKELAERADSIATSAYTMADEAYSSAEGNTHYIDYVSGEVSEVASALGEFANKFDGDNYTESPITQEIYISAHSTYDNGYNPYEFDTLHNVVSSVHDKIFYLNENAETAVLANDVANKALNIAKGKNQARVFDTENDMREWIQNDAIYEIELVGKTLPAGTTIIYSADNIQEGTQPDGSTLVVNFNLNGEDIYLFYWDYEYQIPSVRYKRVFFTYKLDIDTTIESISASLFYYNGNEGSDCSENTRFAYTQEPVNVNNIDYDLIAPHNLFVGDNLYIRELNVPDYWWDGSDVQQLETQKVDLTNYQSKEEMKSQTVEVKTLKIGNTEFTEEQLIKILNFIDSIEMTGGNE